MHTLPSEHCCNTSNSGFSITAGHHPPSRRRTLQFHPATGTRKTPVLLTVGIVQTPPGLPIDGTQSLQKKKLGVLHLCAICDNFQPADVALIALTACDDSNVEVCFRAVHLLYMSR